MNVGSFKADDGTSFIGMAPPSTRTVHAGLRFRADTALADGALFIPQEMEHKWAIYFFHGQLLFIRSWQRRVFAVADVKTEPGWAEVNTVQGTFTAENEESSFTVRVADYLLRTHALELPFPAPLPPGTETVPKKAAMWCFGVFGNAAHYATPHVIRTTTPDQPLRTFSLLHMAVAAGDVEKARALMDSGMSADLPEKHGFTPLHFSLPRDDMSMLLFLLSRGTSIDGRSSEGATPLMLVVQQRSLAKATFLLDHGADVNAADVRGFTALHRAAELGELRIVQLLVDRGASRQPEAQGMTPRTLAEKRGHKDIVAFLSE